MSILTDSNPLTCRELVELVTDWFEGALSRQDRRRFSAHISGCEACTAYLEQMRATIDSLGSLTQDNAPPEAAEALREAFRGWSSERG
jgi:anti-sigma factor RsiW